MKRYNPPYPCPCQANDIIGVWCGNICHSEADAVIVEHMPDCWRGSHIAAGAESIGAAGQFPANGAVRLTVCPDCAASIIEETEGKWARRVAGGATSEGGA